MGFQAVGLDRIVCGIGRLVRRLLGGVRVETEGVGRAGDGGTDQDQPVHPLGVVQGHVQADPLTLAVAHEHGRAHVEGIHHRQQVRDMVERMPGSLTPRGVAPRVGRIADDGGAWRVMAGGDVTPVVSQILWSRRGHGTASTRDPDVYYERPGQRGGPDFRRSCGGA